MDQINKLVEIMAEMLHEQREMLSEQRETNKRLEKLEHQMIMNNASIGELRISVMRLADEILAVHDHERRISELERKVA